MPMSAGTGATPRTPSASCCGAERATELTKAAQLSLRTDTPYAVLEADGDCMTAAQIRQLETVAVQCCRRREALYERSPA